MFVVHRPLFVSNKKERTQEYIFGNIFPINDFVKKKMSAQNKTG
jgi:hypothetical protein